MAGQRFLVFALVFFSFLSGFSGCSNSRYAGEKAASYSRDASYEAGSSSARGLSGGSARAADQKEALTPPAEPGNFPPGQSRKLIRSAELRLRVEDPAETEKPLLSAMEKYGAWASSVRIYENIRDYTIRVPENSYDALLGELGSLGRTVGRSENAEDVTLQYYDLEGRLTTKRELLKTYQSYLGRAKNIEEIMTVEKQIAELQNEIDWTGTRFRALADTVDYATISLEISGSSSGVPYKGPSLGERIGALFVSFGDFLSTALVILAGFFIYGIPLILALAFFFWLFLGRIGLLRKLFRLTLGAKTKTAQAPPGEADKTGAD